MQPSACESPASQTRISCLMVTQNQRLRLLERSLEFYCKQTHTTKELIIVTAGPREYEQAILHLVAPLMRSDIHVIRVPEHFSLGALRNVSMSHASGTILCQWDDDDRHHPQRLETQLQFLHAHEVEGCLLSDQLHYFKDTRELYWTDWSSRKGMPGTVMYRANLGLVYPVQGQYANIGEDTDFQLQLQARFKTVLVKNRGYLYIYVFHGGNTWARKYHVRIVQNLSLSFAYVRERLTLLEEHLRIVMKEEYPFTLICRDGERIGFRSATSAAVLGGFHRCIHYSQV